MERVQGIGGFIFRARNPAELAAWYDEHLGVRPPPDSGDGSPWMQAAGPTAFAPMSEDSDVFDRAYAWSLNFRVADLDAMVEQLRSAGIDVEIDAETYSFGRFARLRDPEGNPLELWEPAER